MPSSSPEADSPFSCRIPENPYLLLTPGPLSTSPAVRAALLRDWCTWDEDYRALTRELRRRLEAIADPAGSFTSIPLQGSGSYAVEALLSSAVPREGGVLVLANGAYGARALETARRLGLRAVELRDPETVPPDPERVRRALRGDPSLGHVFLVHVETTTGIVNPLEEIAAVARQEGRSLLVDAMSSFGGIPFDPVALGISAFATSANKCLQGVPGFALVLARRELLPTWEGRSQSVCLDLFAQWQEFEEGEGKWRFTSPTHVVRAFLEALREFEAEGGVAARHARFCENQRILVEGFRKLGFQTVLSDALQSPVITAFLPGRVRNFRFPDFQARLKERGFVLYPGKLGTLESFRVGSIGHVFPDNMRHLCAAAHEILEAPDKNCQKSEHSLQPGLPCGIQAVLMDWSGTTIDYGSVAPAAVFVEAFAKTGIELSREEARGPMGTAKKDHVRALLALPRVRKEWFRRHGTDPGEADVEELYLGLETRMGEAAAAHTQLIPGHLELLSWLSDRGIPVATGTGYTRAMMKPVLSAAAAQGYVPEVTVLPEDVPAGRPFPYMAFRAAILLGRFPLSHFVKVGDTLADMAEGRNAGCWTVGYSRCGNEMGLTREEDLALPEEERKRHLERARSRLMKAGAHYVVEGPWELIPVLQEIGVRLSSGELP